MEMVGCGWGNLSLAEPAAGAVGVLAAVVVKAPAGTKQSHLNPKAFNFVFRSARRSSSDCQAWRQRAQVLSKASKSTQLLSSAAQLAWDQLGAQWDVCSFG